LTKNTRGKAYPPFIRRLPNPFIFNRKHRETDKFRISSYFD
jgi:hypothetical protein